jgi:protein disulfide-isomerase
MRKIHRLLWAAAGVLLLPVATEAQQPIGWQPTLESAKRLAVQTNRLVLVHFWADWCQACQEMDREVFGQAGVAAAVERDYVPVKINADYFPATCKRYGVTSLPTDVVITPQGHPIDKLRGPLTASEYVARLNQVAVVKRRGTAEAYAQLPAGQPPTPVGQAAPPQNVAGYGYQAPAPQRSPDGRSADTYNLQRQAAALPAYRSDRRGEPVGPGSVQQHGMLPRQPVIPPRQVDPRERTGASGELGPAFQSSSGGRPSSNPSLGLDGYCPVQLSDDMKANLHRWTLGDRRWGAIHRGRTYLFAGPEQQQQFLADPDRYAPVLSGNDVVIAVEQGQTVLGRREHGLLFSNRVYLFASEASLDRFSENPSRYAQQVVQAMRAGGDQRRQLR